MTSHNTTVDLNLVRSEGQQLWIHKDLPANNELADYDALDESGLLVVSGFTGFTGMSSTKPANTKQYDDLGTQNRPGIEVQTSFTLQVDKRVDAAKNTAYDAFIEAYDNNMALTMKHLNSDLSGEWGVFHLTEARPLPEVGQFLLLSCGITLTQFRRIPRPPITP